MKFKLTSTFSKVAGSALKKKRYFYRNPARTADDVRPTPTRRKGHRRDVGGGQREPVGPGQNGRHHWGVAAYETRVCAACRGVRLDTRMQTCARSPHGCARLHACTCASPCLQKAPEETPRGDRHTCAGSGRSGRRSVSLCAGGVGRRSGNRTQPEGCCLSQTQRHLLSR